MAAKSKEAYLVGGPMHSRIISVDIDAERVTIGRMFTYTYAGRAKDGRMIMCIQPKARAQRRWLWHYIGQTGSDPRPEAFAHQRQPFKREHPRLVAGRGRARRAAKRTVHMQSAG